MTHYIEKGGPFAVACAELLKTGLAVPAEAGGRGQERQADQVSMRWVRRRRVGQYGLHLVCGGCDERMKPAGS